MYAMISVCYDYIYYISVCYEKMFGINPSLGDGGRLTCYQHASKNPYFQTRTSRRTSQFSFELFVLTIIVIFLRATKWRF